MAGRLRLHLFDKSADESSSGPPNYRMTGSMYGSNCASCKHFDKQGTCTKYSTPVSPQATCDAFEPMEIDMGAIQNAKPVQPIKANLGPSPTTDFSEPLKFGSFVQKKAVHFPAWNPLSKAHDFMGEFSKYQPAAVGGALNNVTGLPLPGGPSTAPTPKPYVPQEKAMTMPAPYPPQEKAMTIPPPPQEKGMLGPVPAKPPMPGPIPALNKTGAIMNYVEKTARAKRPDVYGSFTNFMTKANNHPDVYSSSMFIPLKTSYEIDGRTPHPAMLPGSGHEQSARTNDKTASTKDAFKRGFLLRCAEEGLSVNETHQRIKKTLDKSATEAGSFFGGIPGKILDLGATAAIGLPIVAGATGGLLYNQLKPSENPESLKREDLRNEYYRLADSIRRRTSIKQMQDKDPGSVVRIV